MLDADLAALYGVSTKRLNEQVRRNRERFPPDFLVELTAQEKTEVVANCDHLARLKYSSSLPFAFTEHGAIMAANVLNSPRAVTVSVMVVRAFVRLRQMLASHVELAGKLAELEKRYDAQFRQVFAAIRALMEPRTTSRAATSASEVPLRSRDGAGISQSLPGRSRDSSAPRHPLGRSPRSTSPDRSSLAPRPTAGSRNRSPASLSTPPPASPGARREFVQSRQTPDPSSLLRAATIRRAYASMRSGRTMALPRRAISSYLVMRHWEENFVMGTMPPRGRYAPSPTGMIHVGNARTALVAWLSVRSRGGTFLWRVEDLDPPRVVPGLAEAQLADLAWLGLDWDEGPDVGGPYAPYTQSQRSADYKEALRRLAVAERFAWLAARVCFMPRSSPSAALFGFWERHGFKAGGTVESGDLQGYGNDAVFMVRSLAVQR